VSKHTCMLTSTQAILFNDKDYKHDIKSNSKTLAVVYFLCNIETFSPNITVAKKLINIRMVKIERPKRDGIYFLLNVDFFSR